MNAGIRYKNFDDEYKKLDYENESDDGLYFEAMFYWRDMDTDPIFCCLQCGEKFK